MFAGIDVASERHLLARLDGAGAPIGRPVAIAEDGSGYARLLELLGPPPALVVMEATGHYWKNLFAVLAAAGHAVALVNPLQARRFQQAGLERTKTDAIDAVASDVAAASPAGEAVNLSDEESDEIEDAIDAIIGDLVQV